MQWKKCWGMIPVGIYITLQICFFILGHLTNSVLRSVPEIVMFWLAIISVLILIFWLGSVCYKWDKVKRMKGSGLLRNIFLALYCFFVCGIIFYGLFISVFRYKAEHIVEHSGIRMVASVNSFLQEEVNYYEYKNFLFHGAEQIGWEDYGNGGNDPLEQEGLKPDRWYFKDLDGNVIERGGENEIN